MKKSMYLLFVFVMGLFLNTSALDAKLHMQIGPGFELTNDYAQPNMAAASFSLDITNIYKPTGHVVLITNKIGNISALELLFIVWGVVGSVYVFYLTSKKTGHILTKATIACYFTVFAIFALIYVSIL